MLITFLVITNDFRFDVYDSPALATALKWRDEFTAHAHKRWVIFSFQLRAIWALHILYENEILVTLEGIAYQSLIARNAKWIFERTVGRELRGRTAVGFIPDQFMRLIAGATLFVEHDRAKIRSASESAPLQRLTLSAWSRMREICGNTSFAVYSGEISSSIFSLNSFRSFASPSCCIWLRKLSIRRVTIAM